MSLFTPIHLRNCYFLYKVPEYYWPLSLFFEGTKGGNDYFQKRRKVSLKCHFKSHTNMCVGFQHWRGYCLGIITLNFVLTWLVANLASILHVLTTSGLYYCSFDVWTSKLWLHIVVESCPKESWLLCAIKPECMWPEPLQHAKEPSQEYSLVSPWKYLCIQACFCMMKTFYSRGLFSKSLQCMYISTSWINAFNVFKDDWMKSTFRPQNYF